MNGYCLLSGRFPGMFFAGNVGNGGRMMNTETSEILGLDFFHSVRRRSLMSVLLFSLFIYLWGSSVQTFSGLTCCITDDYCARSDMQGRSVQSLLPPFSVRKYFDWRCRRFMLDNRYCRHHLWTFDGFHWTCYKLTTFQTWDLQRWIKNARLKPETRYVRRPFGSFREIPIYRFR